ncbi:DNA-3-methyladenine glycosylase family protein [Mesobacillus foraminis]|uniref:DNA-3-methyladenine glycosylase II n=1 Tax=Mesobacillus foraminis TaxID=279826 RepID=A0A4R2B6V5_9BACI|nr:DNA-3-methyladenine glycosylase [Mesobacillus foraminis]TCN22296.1 DNA-3-methyladenine glycosylase II [Mesobacillus foraminis]
MWEETISITGPYNFDLALDRLSLDPLHCVDKEKKTVKVPVTIGTRQVAAVVTGTGSLEKPEFLIKSEAEKESVVPRLYEIFGWNVELLNVHEHFQTTDLKALFNDHYGTPLVLDFDPFGCLLKCIIHQQLNLAFAYTLTQRFVTAFGNEVDGIWFYPNPERVASLKVGELRDLQFSGRKAEYVIGIATMAVEGKLDFKKMRDMPDAEIANQLIKVRGVGPWTVQNFLMFGLGRPNLFPTADIGLQNAIKKYYHLDEKPTLAEMEQLKVPWEPYLSYASLYLWRSIE